MSSSNSITSIMTAILLASTTMTIVYVGIPGNMKIAYAGDDSGRSLIDISSIQGFKATKNYEYGCDELDGDAVWCV